MAGIDIAKFHGATEAKRHLRHDDKEMREKDNHTNKDINKDLTKYNTSGRCLSYKDKCQLYDDVMADLDKNPKGNHRPKKVTLVSFELTCPAEITGEDRNKWFDRVDDLFKDRFGPDNFLDSDRHFDEIHDYVDPDTKETIMSRAHTTVKMFPIVDDKDRGPILDCKRFTRQYQLKRILGEVQKMTQDEFGCDYVTGRKSKNREYTDVESLKAASDKAEALQKAQEALQKAQEAENARQTADNARQAAEAAQRASEASQRQAEERARKAEEDAAKWKAQAEIDRKAAESAQKAAQHDYKADMDNLKGQAKEWLEKASTALTELDTKVSKVNDRRKLPEEVLRDYDFQIGKILKEQPVRLKDGHISNRYNVTYTPAAMAARTALGYEMDAGAAKEKEKAAGYSTPAEVKDAADKVRKAVREIPQGFLDVTEKDDVKYADDEYDL